MNILAIDQGTTSTRGLIYDLKGHSELVFSQPHAQYYPHANYVEQDALEILANIKKCIELSLSSGINISAIGIANQGESCLAWDSKDKQPICPIIVWQDSRTEAMIEQIKTNANDALIKQISGLSIDAYFSASKLSWIIKNIPKAKQLIDLGRLRLGTTDTFFLDALCNQFVTDISTASRTALLNINQGVWSKQLCDLFEIPIQCLANIVPSTGNIANINMTSQQIPVSASIVDQQASLFGHGCEKQGDVKITFGTGAFVLALTGKKIVNKAQSKILTTIAWQHHDNDIIYALDGGVYSAASALNWAKSLNLFEHYDELDDFANHTAIERKLVFVPALVGLACPYWDRNCKASWLGLSINTSEKDMLQAILEGVSFRAAEVIQQMAREIELKNMISIDGGLSQNKYFCQFLANVLNKEIHVNANPEVTSLGCAKLAAIGIGENINDMKSIQKYEVTEDLTGYLDVFKKAVTISQRW